MKEGCVVKSLKGHDTGRIYTVIAVIGDSFVLVADGKYRKLDNPKQKRIKHLEIVREAALPSSLTVSALRIMCKL